MNYKMQLNKRHIRGKRNIYEKKKSKLVSFEICLYLYVYFHKKR